MYLIDCRDCRTSYSNEARLCPICGHVTDSVRSTPGGNERFGTPEARSGETTWRPLHTYPL